MSNVPLTDNPIVFLVLLLIAIAIVYPIMKMIGGNSLTQQKQEEIERKRAALIANRKAAARAQAEAARNDPENPA